MIPMIELDPSNTAILIRLLFTKVKVHKMKDAKIKKAADKKKAAFDIGMSFLPSNHQSSCF